MKSKLISAILDPKIYNPFDGHAYLVSSQLLQWVGSNIKNSDQFFWNDIGIDCSNIVEGMNGVKRSFKGNLKDYIIYINGHDDKAYTTNANMLYENDDEYQFYGSWSHANEALRIIICRSYGDNGCYWQEINWQEHTELHAVYNHVHKIKEIRKMVGECHA